MHDGGKFVLQYVPESDWQVIDPDANSFKGVQIMSGKH